MALRIIPILKLSSAQVVRSAESLFGHVNDGILRGELCS
jgi:hypothetical protein